MKKFLEKIFISIQMIREKNFSKMLEIVVWFSILIAVFWQVGSIPLGLFCDEIEIANIAAKLTNGELKDYFVPPFFYRHFDYQLGFLPVLATAPFTLFGLSEVFVRTASVVYALISLVFIYQTLKMLKQPTNIPLLMLTFTPLFFHISRVNFGHTISFLFITIAIWSYFKFIFTYRLKWISLSGVCIAISAYGYGGYMLGAPVVLGALVITEVARQLFFQRITFLQRKHFMWLLKTLLLFFGSFICVYSAILWQSAIDENFSQRLRDKSADLPTGLLENTVRIFSNYPKYFSLEYLFTRGESDANEAFITRHTVHGNGIYLGIYLPILLFALFAFFFITDKKKIYYFPFFLIFFFAPFPDLMTTSNTDLPYSLSYYFSLISVPFLTAYGLRAINFFSQTVIPNNQKNILQILFVCAFIINICFFYTNYQKYPTVSSNYWGWQYGPKLILKYFHNHKLEYDELYMTGLFNQAQSLFNFYNSAIQCQNCAVGGVTDHLDRSKRQLFVIRPEEIESIPNDFIVQEQFYFRSGELAYIAIEYIVFE